MQYAKGDELREYARLLIGTHYPALTSVAIAYVFAEAPKTRRGRDEHAVIKKFPEELRPLIGGDDDVEYAFLVSLSIDAWNGDPMRREALLSECLERVELEEREVKKGKNKGKVVQKLTLRPPDAEVFVDLFRRYGAYRPDLAEVLDAATEVYLREHRQANR